MATCTAGRSSRTFSFASTAAASNRTSAVALADGWPRRAHPQLHLGTDRHPLHVATEGIGEEGVPLVAAVVSYPGTAAAVWFLAALVVWLSGLQLLALGMVGQYVWRALDEARKRPIYVVEAVTKPTVK